MIQQNLFVLNQYTSSQMMKRTMSLIVNRLIPGKREKSAGQREIQGNKLPRINLTIAIWTSINSAFP